MTTPSQPLDDQLLDILIVGSGFGGIYQLYNYRKLGYTVRLFEAASDLGGIWYWNCYPGARVDSEVPLYEFSLPELWKDWHWTERFPGWEELRRYFAYVETKLDVKKDISFNTRVVSASWETTGDRWIVKAENGVVVHPRFLVLCTGFAAKPYLPKFKGLDTFKGVCHHTAKWPQEGVELKGKRVGVIGTGASGVQVIQEIGKEVEHLAVFQRTPNFAIPMMQKKLTKEEQDRRKDDIYPVIYRRRRQTFNGFWQDPIPKSLFSATPEERILQFEQTWGQGGFTFLINNFNDIMSNEKANEEVYAFWRKKVRVRLVNPDMQEKLAPTIAPHPLGAKRPSLEQHYYEIYNQSNVTLTDLSKVPIEEVTPTGIKTADGVHHDLEVIVLATGFDSVTGGITQINIRGKDGSTIEQKWTNGVYTALGMTTMGFPNMFFMYGPQGPTAFCNGPTCIEIQGEWIINCIKYMMDKNLTSIEPLPEAEEEWRRKVFEATDKGLWMKAKGWYNGANIPGKVVEPLNYAGGVSVYAAYCAEKARSGYEGFILSRRLVTGQIERVCGKVEGYGSDNVTDARQSQNAPVVGVGA